MNREEHLEHLDLGEVFTRCGEDARPEHESRVVNVPKPPPKEEHPRDEHPYEAWQRAARKLFSPEDK